MKRILLLLLAIVPFASTFSQSKDILSVKVNYGLNGNFFVKQYDELSGTPNKTFLYKKDFLGTISGADLAVRIGKNSELGIAYSRSINKRERSYSGTISGVQVSVIDFSIRHINNFYQLYYQRSLKRVNDTFKFQLGGIYARMNQQEIEISNYLNEIRVEERNFKNSNLEELGLALGVEYQRKIDTHFDLGLQVKAYYLITVETLEAITLTPTLTYRF